MQLKRNSRICDFLLKSLFNFLGLRGLGCRGIMQKHLYHWSPSQTIRRVLMHFKCASLCLVFEIHYKQNYFTAVCSKIKYNIKIHVYGNICGCFVPTCVPCTSLNPLNPELNPICYLLALLRAQHFLHVSRIRVKLLTFRLLMSYIYGAPILDVSRSHTTQHSR